MRYKVFHGSGSAAARRRTCRGSGLLGTGCSSRPLGGKGLGVKYEMLGVMVDGFDGVPVVMAVAVVVQC